MLFSVEFIMKYIISSVLIVLFLSSLVEAKSDKQIVAEASEWAKAEINNLSLNPEIFLKFNSNSEEKQKDVSTFKQMLKKDVVFCSESLLDKFNNKLAFVATKYPILGLNYICYESELPSTGFYNQSLLVVSSQTIQSLTDEEFLSVVGHELGHTFFTDEMSKAILQNDYETPKLIELKCDVIALALLKHNKIKSGETIFISALNKHTELLQNAKYNKKSYISDCERIKFIGRISEILDGFNINKDK